MKPGDADALTTSAATPSRPAPASTRSGCRGSTARGYPIRPSDGRPVDNIGRLVNAKGLPIHDDGELLRDPDGLPLPPAPANQGLRRRPRRRTASRPTSQGAWYRCCGGTVRKLWDCCAHHDQRINGDAALHGYCYGGRKVFCVTYYQTHVPC